MKKLMTLILVILSVSLMADMKKINDVQDRPATKDWYGYYGTSYYVYDDPGERAVYIDADDFGLEYPIEFSRIQWYLYDAAGATYHYNIYDKDGSTLLASTADSLSIQGWHVTVLDAPLVLADDFWVALVPQADGAPGSIFDAGDGVGGHSYLGTAGAWSYLYGGAYNHSVVFDLAPHTGTDLYPPTARGILGNETFMDKDATVSIRVMDQSAIASVTGDYSFDNWGTSASFTLNATKSTYVYSGTIPGQPDGTVGAVRFNMEDALGHTSTSDDFEISWDKDNPVLFEGFENVVFPANGWTLNTTGAGFIEGVVTNGDAVHTGSKSATHLDDSGPQDDWLISPLVSLPAANPSTLTFWQYGNWLNYVVSGYHEVAVSTDLATWDVIYTGHPDGGPTGVGRVWEYMTLSLMAYMGQDVYIGFRFVGDYEDIWTIDDIAILYDYEAPVLEDIMGNTVLFDSDSLVGAYLNNDMVLNLDVFDLSGVATVVGHYSFDGGTTVVDLNFAQAKGTEEWTGTIPAMAAEATGTINFDLTDIGGLSITTPDYNIDFVKDTTDPIFGYVTGTEAFVGSPMNLTVAFTDESAITSVGGYFSKDNYIFDNYSFELTPSKVHQYTYEGTIPAESAEVLDGQVYFTIIDAENNILTTAKYTVQWKDGQVEFFEDFESGDTNWNLGGNWAVVEEGEYTSATHALTESPGGDYVADEISSVSLAADRDWSSYFGAKMSFWCKYDIEHGFDYMYFDVTTDGGTTWTNLRSWDDEGIDWHEEKISLDAFVGGTFNFRFRFEADGGYEANGMYIDDISLITYNIDHAAPLTVYSPYKPDFYQGSLYAYTNNVDVLDNSGVNAVGVVYSVDGVPQTDIAATFVSGNQWEFTIPAQAPGAVIDYSFWAQDASTNLNEELSTDVYTIIAGDHQVYDTPVVTYRNSVEDGDAFAVKVTVPGTDASNTYSADLVYLLLRNYADTSLSSDDMTVRVWQDDAGLPGIEVLTPFTHTPEANALKQSAMSMLDIRSEALTVYGDFWIGFSAPASGIVHSTEEVAADEGTTAYQRSYVGSDNGDGTWNWTLKDGYNLHFRAVLGEATGIEEGNMPLTTSLEQNYPNPFNPTTTINFTIANEAKTSLVVYDVMGRAVAKLVDGNLSKGSHKVSFDASNLVSGVYYYNLKSGNVNQTKKMMLIK
ncbi:MAG: choice-of-anchor J domain-containing protein [Candidatus Delongbacteria bacterium]|nr:choice-of-anchor J domain-containing protein [Candidatus Delongbacteria bacterium]